MRRVETLGVGQRIERVVESPFERRRQRDVANRAARLADQVMVVLGEVLGELVPSMVGRVHQPSHDAHLLHHREIAVGGTLREHRGEFDQLGQRDRTVR